VDAGFDAAPSPELDELELEVDEVVVVVELVAEDEVDVVEAEVEDALFSASIPFFRPSEG
jgi:hypothetical protein